MSFPDLIRSAVKTDSYKMEGVGGARNMDTASLSSLRFSIGGIPGNPQPGCGPADTDYRNQQIF
jgi:hypothetical protein